MVGLRGRPGAGGAIAVGDFDAGFLEADVDHLALVLDELADLTLEAFHDLVHAAHRLEEGGLPLEVEGLGELVTPELGLEQRPRFALLPRCAALVAGQRIRTARTGRAAIGFWRAAFLSPEVAVDREPGEELRPVRFAELLIEASLS